MQVKVEYHESGSEYIPMDFVIRLSMNVKSNNAFWMIVNLLIKSTHFIPFRDRLTTKLLVKIFMQGVRLNVIAIRIL